MSNQTKIIIGIGSVIAMIMIGVPIWYYIKDFYDLPRSSNPQDWGTFGDFFGGILNPIISLLTLIVTIIIAVNISKIEKRNHEESVHSPVKPLIVIESADFFSSSISANGLSVEKDFYDYNPPQGPAGPHDYLTKQFYLNISNKGLGIATHISVTYEINLSELKELLTIDDQKITVVTRGIHSDDDGRKSIVPSIKSDNLNYRGSFIILERERDWLAPINKGEVLKAYLPAQLIKAFQLHNLIKRLKHDDTSFPAFFVTFNFKNIHGKDLKSKFKVGLIHRYDYAYYSLFKILNEQIE